MEREPNHYRHTDAAHAEALVRIAGAHPTLRQTAVSQMCRALIADQRMAGIVLNSGARSLRAEPAVVSAVCAEPANGGNMYAALAIIVADKDQTPAAPAAQRMLDAVTTPRVHVPGIVEFAGGWQEAATLTRALQPPDRARLADAMTAVISDTEEPAINRQLASQPSPTSGGILATQTVTGSSRPLSRPPAATWPAAPTMTQVALRAGRHLRRNPRPGGALIPLLGGDAERFGMGPAVMLGQDLADVAGPVCEGAVAELAAGDRQMGDGHREAAGMWRAHHLP